MIGKNYHPEPQPVKQQRGSHEAKSILLVDDDSYVCELMRLITEHHHWQITVFQTADDALIYLRTHNPDIIIIDLMLPRLNGWQVFQKMRETLPHLSSKFVATTAYYSYDTEQRIRKHGFDGFLSKPFEATKLIDFLSSLLD